MQFIIAALERLDGLGARIVVPGHGAVCGPEVIGRQRQWNDNPQSFTWTKSADEILERLAAHLDRIPGAAHWRLSSSDARSDPLDLVFPAANHTVESPGGR